tara:strand:+ start:1928 stop:2044 length:117 start_codon:yes stop_codon:yes gene_type:complete
LRIKFQKRSKISKQANRLKAQQKEIKEQYELIKKLNGD